MITQKKISITIPAYNEEQSLERTVKSALHSISQLVSNYELLLVNDGSTDRTREIMDTLKAKNKNIRVIHHPINMGFSGAMNSCYKKAHGDLIFLGPADGQFDYSELVQFINAAEHADMVTAYRVTSEEGFDRKLYSFLFHLISRLLFNIQLKEFSTCILYTKQLRDSIAIQAHPFSCLFLPELIYKSLKLKYRIAEVPIHFYKRKGGKRKGANIIMIAKTVAEMLKFWVEIRLDRI